MIKKMLCFIIMSAALFAQSQDSLSSSFGRQIISKNDLQNAGVVRLSDVFSLLNASAGNTIDDYRKQVSINFLTPGWEQEWALFLDGQKIDLDYPYMKNINILPISVSEISFVEVISLPGIESGEYHQAGVIHIHTIEPEEGISINASLSSANEIGDPGPYKYTDPLSPNIDQVGPYYWASIKWGSPNFKLRFGFKHHLQIYTDPNINHRFYGYPWEFINLRMLGISLKLDFNIAGSNHSLFISRTETGENALFSGYGSDLLFFNPAGKEISTEPKHTHIGLNGAVKLSASVKLNYNLKFSSSLLDWTLAPEDNLFDWNINNLSGLVELKSLKEFSKTKLSFGFENVNLITHYSLSGDSYTLFKVNGQTRGITSNKFEQLLYGVITTDGIRSAFNAGTSMAISANKDVTIKGNISYSSKLPEENSNLWFWVNKGYGFLHDYNIHYEGSSKQKVSRLITGDLEFQFRAGDGFIFSIGAFYRKFADYHLERQYFTYDQNALIAQAQTQLSNNENGAAAGFTITIDNIISSSLKQNLFYQYNPYYDGSEIFNDTWQSFPENKIKYTLDFSPMSSLSIMGMITYLSETYWPAYSGADEITGGIINDIVDGNLIVDLAVRKTFWNNKIRATLAVRNMAGNYVQLHPAGALFDITLFMKLELMLDSIL